MTSPFGSRAGPFQSRETGTRLRRASAPRPTKPSDAPAHRAESPGRPRSEKGRRRAGSSEDREIDQADDAQPEKERVSLEVSDLKQPEQRTEAPRRAACAANGCAVQDPAVDERAQLRQQFLGRADQERIEFVEVKPFP